MTQVVVRAWVQTLVPKKKRYKIKSTSLEW
jgi:hypothetical protein